LLVLLCAIARLVYKDGKVCISILHEAKADEFNTQEKMSEKWSAFMHSTARVAFVDSLPPRLSRLCVLD
jgi:hypothetical protein